MIDTFRPDPKDRPWRSKEYRKWLKQSPCALRLPGCTEISTDIHHTITRGSWGSDVVAIPACRSCHTQEKRVILTEQFRIAFRFLDKYLTEIGVK